MKKRAEDLTVGDVIEFLGTARTITRIDPYHGPFDALFAVARSGPDWGISLASGSFVDVAELSCGEPGHDYTDHLTERPPTT